MINRIKSIFNYLKLYIFYIFLKLIFKVASKIVDVAHRNIFRKKLYNSLEEKEIKLKIVNEIKDIISKIILSLENMDSEYFENIFEKDLKNIGNLIEDYNKKYDK